MKSNEYNELVISLQTIKDYCTQQDNCDYCAFKDSGICKTPETWNIAEMVKAQ